MLSEVIGAIASHLMEVNSHKVSPKKIGADRYEDLARATGAIALGEGWNQLSYDSPVIYLRQFNVVFLSGIVTAANSTATSELIGTVSYQVAPTDFISVSEAAIKTYSGIQVCSIAVSPGGEISKTKPQLLEDILWLSQGGLSYLIGDNKLQHRINILTTQPKENCYAPIPMQFHVNDPLPIGWRI